LRVKGDTGPAIAELIAARAINEKLVKDIPDQPRYRSLLAENLMNLALATEGDEPARAEELYRAAMGLFDELVSAYPENVDYRILQAQCLQNQGATLASAGQSKRAEEVYRRAIAHLDGKEAKASQTGMEVKAEVLNNLGDLLRGAGRPEAEAIFRQAQGLFTELASRPAATLGDRHNLAIAEYNLGETLFGLKRPQEAEAMLARAETDFEKLVVAAPKSVDFHSQLGLVQGRKGVLLADGGRLPEAAAVLAKAVGHQDRAVHLSANRTDTRTLLGGHLLDLAEVNLKRGAFQEAADDALRMTRVVPDAGRGEACFDAARILARLVGLVDADAKRVPADRERMVRPYLGRSIVLLREAIDSNPKLAGRIKDDPAIKALDSRPEFKTMMNSLVDVGR
jgi:tetratricopeptide (TPR) repeat protein